MTTSVAAKYSARLKTTVAGKAPEAQAGGKRFGTLLVFDTSGSTGMPFKGNPADIDTINASLPKILSAFRDAPRTSPLGKAKKNIDIAIVGYGADVNTILDWTAADALPPMVAPLTSGGGTASGKALMQALQMAKAYQGTLRSRKIPIGLVNILHFTDGMPTDMSPGDAMWKQVQDAYGQVTKQTTGQPSAEPAKRAASIVHLVTPNGCDPDFCAPAQGAGAGPRQGLERLSELTGPTSVHTLDSGLRLVDTLVELVSGIVIKTSVFGKSGDEAAKTTVEQMKDDKDANEEDTPID